jgi:MFS family permease
MTGGGQRKAPVVLTVLVAALGYFVDIYDLILFTIVRVKSLQDLGVPKAELLDTGVVLLNWQMGGMLLGGILWGVLGDKKGRLSVLFGSIFMYSVANIANGFVASIPQYAFLRFIAGIGLAGELGAGITLVSEVMNQKSRGYGTTIVATVGICGAIVAVLVGDLTSWRTAYFVGGGMGLALLLLRVGLYESGMFEGVKSSGARLGNFFGLFSSWERSKKYGAIILSGVPIWYAVGILIAFSPELGAAMGMKEAPKAGQAVMLCYIGLAVGDLGSGALSQIAKSRRKVLLGFITLTAVSVVVYFLVGRSSLTVFYAVCGLLGFATGYWAVFVTTASELFGTNIRATVTTTAPNFVRGAVVPLTVSFKFLKDHTGIVWSAIIVGSVTLLVAFLSLIAIEETYGKNLDYVED